tara:strand:+ start:68 stop:313 length:246 start_codon:yes stop_codon:yes gene_type:complete
MPIRHKQQRSGKVSVSGYLFSVLDDGTLAPEPSDSQAEILLNFSSLFERLGEDGEPIIKKKADMKPAPKAAPKRAARRGKK